MTRRTGFIGAALLAIALAGACTGDDTNDRRTVEGDGYHGVLLDAHLDYLQPKDGPGIDHGVDSFVPTTDDVEQFEDQASAALATAGNPSGANNVTAAELRTYLRQYTGVAAIDESGKAQRHLVVQGICADAADDGTDWTSGWVEVADGGTCFWDATMDLVSGEILRFGFHGSA
jgi:hypothetical protein